MLTFADRVLGLHLGLGDLGSPRDICHGYANACVCPDCSEREEEGNAAPAPPKQPWEARPAA